MKSIVLGLLFAIGASCAASAASWSYEEVKDPISDAKRGIAVLPGDGGKIIVKCDDNGPRSIYVEVLADKYLGATDNMRRAVIMRLDDGALVTTDWLHDGATAITDGGDAGLATAVAVSSAKKVVFRLSTFDGDEVDVVATSDGDSTSVRHAFETCGETDGAFPTAAK